MQGAGAYAIARGRSCCPIAIACSRQGCANLQASSAEAVARGAYVLSSPPPGEAAQLVLVGSGSEVQLLVAALPALGDLRVQLVSMPSWELFDAQPTAYRLSVFPPAAACLAVEALAAEGWAKYAPSVIGMRSFGASGPAKEVQKHFGFTVDNVVAKARELLAFYEEHPLPCLLRRPDNL